MSNRKFKWFKITFSLNLFVSILLFSQPAEWLPRGMGGGGAFFSPVISPFDVNEYYVASDMSDLFHSTDSGATWDVVSFTQIMALNETRIQFTSDPNVRYTVHSDWRRFPVKSTDGGETWQSLPGIPVYEPVYYVFADWNHTERLIASYYSEILYSDDGGQSFRTIHQNLLGDAGTIGGVFWHDSLIVVGLPRGLLVSHDLGNSFALDSIPGIPKSEGMISFCGGVSQDTVRFFVVTLSFDNIWPTVNGSEHWGYQHMYTLDFDLDSTWQSSTNGIQAGHHPFYVDMARNQIDTVYLAGGDGLFPIVYKTIDGGKCWQSVLQTQNNQNVYTGWSGSKGDHDWWYGEFALGLAVAPYQSDHVLFTDLGFLHGTKDGGSTWQALYIPPDERNPKGAATPKGLQYHSNGLENTSVWWISWADSNNLFAGYSDIMAKRSTDGGLSWTLDIQTPYVNTFYMIQKHPTTGHLYAVTSSIHDLYESTRLQDSHIDGGTGDIRVSTDKGASWSVVHDFGSPVIWSTFDPANPNRWYASVIHSTTGGIYVCEDISQQGQVWQKLADPPRTEHHPFNICILKDSTIVCTYSGRINSSESFTASSGVFVSEDHGQSWTDRSHPNMQYWTRDLVLDPSDSTQSTWYAGVYSGWGGAPNGLGGLYRTFNRGLSWEKLGAWDRVSSCTFDPDHPNILYVTTEEEGLWYSENIQELNPTFELIETYPFKHPQRVFYNPYDANEIWIASFGNGLRVGHFAQTSIQSRSEVTFPEPSASIYPNPSNGRIGFYFQTYSAGDVVLRIFNLLGQLIDVVDAGRKPAGEQSIFYDTSHLFSGLYLYQLSLNGQVKRGKLIVVR